MPATKNAWPGQYIAPSDLRQMWLTLEMSPHQAGLVRKMHDWGQQAECKGSPLFTLDMYGMDKEHRLDVEQKAKALCSICPVRDECYTHAMSYPELGGIWGGLTQQEREALRKRARDDRHRRCVS